MIYFFVKGETYLQCEIYPGCPHVLTYVDSNGRPRTETYRSGLHLQERWLAVQQELVDQGWTGPLGRDARA